MRIDNTTAISYINRMGGIKFPLLNNLARDIWRWCELRDIWVFASYVRSSHNLADIESRRISVETEWKLSNTAFDMILKKFGNPVIDLFATKLNSKCIHYVSWVSDPGAEAIDAFTICWSNKFFYAFPPFAVILKVLRKIQAIFFKSSVSNIISCLTQQLAKGWSYSFLNTLRSAICLISIENYGSNPLLRRFFKGISNISPASFSSSRLSRNFISQQGLNDATVISKTDYLIGLVYGTKSANPASNQYHKYFFSG